MPKIEQFRKELVEYSTEIDAEHEHEFKSGNQFKTKNYGIIEIIEYVNCLNILVRFVDTGYEIRSNASNIRQGKIKDRLAPSMRGIGVIGETITVDAAGNQKASYKAWGALFERVTTRDSYSRVTVSSSFITYSDFEKWYDKNISLYPEDLRVNLTVDSDLIPFVRGTHKSYGAETCILIRNSINTSFMQIQKTLNSLSTDDSEERFNKASLIIEKFIRKFEKDALPYLPQAIQTELKNLETKLWENYYKPRKNIEQAR